MEMSKNIIIIIIQIGMNLRILKQWKDQESINRKLEWVKKIHKRSDKQNKNNEFKI
jgi:hypothetical protein